MLSYRHSFHAGNHADVLKHLVLVYILQALAKKDKGFLYLDTHAGAGKYDLHTDSAQKTAEYKQAIEKLWYYQQALPKLVLDYLAIIRSFNTDGNLRYYPGSPLIAKTLLRKQDQAIFSELHSTDIQLLQQLFATQTNIKVQKSDGYQQIKACLPPISRRGLICIDPSYELKTDYLATANAVITGYRKFSTGCYAIWYPVVLRNQTEKLLQTLQQSQIKKILQLELAVAPDSNITGMTASGMLVINPPWQLVENMQQILPILAKLFATNHQGSWLINWLNPE